VYTEKIDFGCLDDLLTAHSHVCRYSSDACNEFTAALGSDTYDPVLWGIGRLESPADKIGRVIKSKPTVTIFNIVFTE
jgi:hypothetical protein